MRKTLEDLESKHLLLSKEVEILEKKRTTQRDTKLLKELKEKKKQKLVVKDKIKNLNRR